MSSTDRWYVSTRVGPELLLLFQLILAGCGGRAQAVDSGSTGCVYNGRSFRPNDTFMIDCSGCSCDVRGVAVCSYNPCPDGGTTPYPRACGTGQTCNEDPTLDDPRSDPYCSGDGTCSCGTKAKSPYTGRCLDVPGDDGRGCEYGGTAYAVGTTVPIRGCRNQCVCALPGVTSCPPSACVPCLFSQDAAFTMPSGLQGAFLRMQSAVGLTNILAGSDLRRSCGAPLPTCDSPTAVDASDINADIADADVQRALTTAPRPIYGDRSASGGSHFTFSAASGGFSVVVGHECPMATPTCEPAPAGVARLLADVNTVVSTALNDPSCASLR